MSASTPPTGGPVWDQRCIDCVPFRQLTERVERLDTKVDGLEGGFRRLSHEVTELGHKFDKFQEPLQRDMLRVVQLLEGNGKPQEGFAHRLLTLETEHRRRGTWMSRLVWLLIGIAVTGGWGLLSSAIGGGG